MSNLATLVLGAETAGLLKGEKALKDTTIAAGKTEGAARGVTGQFVKAGKASTTATGLMSKGMKSAAAAAVGLAAATLGISASIRTLREFETSVSRMGAISGATTGELERMRDVAKDLGSTTEFSAKQAADGLSFLAMAGFNAAESIAAIPAVLDLATASGMGLAQAADTASNIMVGFGLAAAEAAVVTDVLAAASSRSNTSVSQLGAAMSTVAPIANTLNMSVAQTAAAIGVMSDAGIQGERAGTGLRGVLAALAGPTDQATEVFNRLGVSVGDLDPAANSLAEIMATLGEKGLSTADAMTVFGREASSGALVLIEGAQRLNQFGKELTNVDGAAQEMANTMRDNLGGDIDGLFSALSGLIITLGEAGLTAILRGVISTVTAVTRAVSGLVEGMSAFGSFVADLFSFSRGMNEVQAASDVANLAIADQLAQVNALSVAMAGGITMSRQTAEVKLIQAKASHAAAEATRQENIENAKSSPIYLRMAEDIEKAQLNLLDAQELARDFDSSGLEGLEYAAKLAALNVETMAAELRGIVAEQDEVIAAAQTGTEAFAASEAAIVDLEEALVKAKGNVIVLNGEVQNAADTAAALARLAGGVNFDDATASAARLAAQLGISVALAARMNALGPQQAEGAGRGRGGDPRSMGGSFLDYSVRDADAFLASLNEIRVTAGGGGGGAAKSVSDLTRETKALNDEIERLEFDADPLKAYNAEIANLDMLLENGLSDGAYRKAVDDLNEGLLNSSPIVNSLTDAFGTFLTQGANGFDQFKNTIVDGFKSMIAEMIATAARNRIMISLGMAGSVAGSAASAGVGAGGMAGTAGLASVAMNGATASLSAFSGGISAGFGQIGATMAGATSSLAGFAAAAGAVAAPILIAIAVFKFFEKSTKTLDEGLRVTTNGMTSLIDSFEKIQTSRFFGLSKKVHTEFDAMGAAADPLRETIGQMQASIMDAAATFGFGADAFAGFSHEFTLSLKGLDEAAQQSAIAEELTNLGNAFAGMTGAFATTQELVAAATENYALTNRLLEAQGKSTELLTRQRNAEMDATHALNQPLLARINLLEDEAAATQRAAEIASQNYALTDRLLEAQGKSTELLTRQRKAETDATHALNQPLLTRLHLLEDEAVATEAANAAMQGAVDAALAPIDGLLDASRSAASVARNSANEFFRLADSLREASGNIGGVTTAADLASEGQKFAQMFAKAITGDVDALNSLGGAGQSLATDSAGFATSATELKRMQAGIRSQLDQGAAVAEVMGLGADYQALTYDLQTAALQVTRDLLVSGEMTVELMRQQIELLDDIGGLITDSANIQVQTGVNAAGQTVAALLDNSGRVIAGMSVEGAAGIAALESQTTRSIVGATLASSNLGNRLFAAIDIDKNGVISAIESQSAQTIRTHQSTALALASAVDRNGAMTAAQIRASLAGKASDSAINQVVRAVDINGDGIVTADEASRAATIAKMNASQSASSHAMALGRLSFSNAITGQTASVTGTQRLTNAELAKVQGLQGQTVGLTRLVEAAARGNQTLSGQLLSAINNDIGVVGISDVTRGLGAVSGLLQLQLVGQQELIMATRYLNLASSAKNVLSSISGSGDVGSYFTDRFARFLPSFATGGSHSGGMRIVGENGPELEFTGPSQILNANQTKAAISGGSQGNSDAGVRADLQELRRVMVEVVKYVKRTSDIERKHDIDGMPAVRT